MKVHYECASCFLRQAREALDLATEDTELKMEITEQINQILCNEFRRELLPTRSELRSIV